jgi:hypothetical protein
MADSAGPCDSFISVFESLNKFKRLEAQVICADHQFLCMTKPIDDVLDKKALCGLFCCCLYRTPSVDGKRYKQNCVDEVLGKVNADNKSYFKPEVSFKPNGDVADYGETYSSRPDIVVVKDPSQPMSADNVQRVYEMKFDGDYYNWFRGQGDRYAEIFGKTLERHPLTNKGPKSQRCDCDDLGKTQGDEAKQAADEWSKQASDELAGLGSGSGGGSSIPPVVPPPGDSSGRGRGNQGTAGGAAAALGALLGRLLFGLL